MAPIKQLVLVALVMQMLCVAVLGYVVMPLNQKSNYTLQERHDQAKRGNAPLGGGMARVGYYYVHLTIGSQTFQVDIDTGSSTLYVVGPDCHYLDARSTPCTYALSYYQGGASYRACQTGCDDCQHDVCIMHSKYGDGSQVYGAVRDEWVAVGDYGATSPVGISYYQTSTFAAFSGETFMDGLWGMAYASLNGGQATVIDRMVSAGMPNVFSMCFNEPAIGTAGGYLVMGGIDTTMHTGTVQYTPIVSFDYYSIGVSDVAVASSNLELTFPNTFVDSGTTFTYVPVGIYNSIRDAMVNEGMNSDWFMAPNGEIPCSLQALISLPTLSFILPKVGGGTFSVSLSPSQYTITCGNGGHRAFGLVPTNDNMVILGDTFMHASNTIFDREHNQIGFAPVSANCNGAVELNSEAKSVPGTKSQFSDSTAFLPSLAILALSFSIFLIMN